SVVENDRLDVRVEDRRENRVLEAADNHRLDDELIVRPREGVNCLACRRPVRWSGCGDDENLEIWAVLRATRAERRRERLRDNRLAGAIELPSGKIVAICVREKSVVYFLNSLRERGIAFLREELFDGLHKLGSRISEVRLQTVHLFQKRGRNGF